ncbi:MAG: hypothetical protein ACRDBQ_18605 [Shewanella sp.]
MGYWLNHVKSMEDRAKVAVESIRHQDRKKLESFAAVIGKFRTSKDYSQQNYDVSGISEWIGKNLGLGVYMTTGAELGVQETLFAGVFVPQIDANNPIITTMTKQLYRGNKDLDLYTKLIKDNQLTGHFDDANAMVTGDLSKIRSNLIISPLMFEGEEASIVMKKVSFTDYELAAIIFHECGHIRTYLRNLMQCVVTNMLADAAANRIMEIPDEASKMKVVRDVERMLDTPFKNPETIAKGDNKEAVYTHLVTQIALERANVIGSKAVGNRMWERASDDFAIRMGAGSDLASALYKMESAPRWLWRHKSYCNPYMHFIGQAIYAAALVVGIMYGEPVAAVLYGLTILTYAYAENPENTTYDPPEERYKTIRRGLMEELNLYKDLNTKSANANRQRCLDDIARLDGILRKVSDKDSAMAFLLKTLTPYGRREAAAVDYQHAVERYLSSDLNAAAARLAAKAFA